MDLGLSSLKDLLPFSFWTLVICSCWQSGSLSEAASDSTFSGGPAVDKWMTAQGHWESPLCCTSGSEDVFLGNCKDGFNGIHIYQFMLVFFCLFLMWITIASNHLQPRMIKLHKKKKSADLQTYKLQLIYPTSYCLTLGRKCHQASSEKNCRLQNS